MPIRKALKWVGFWVGLAMLFNLGIFLLAPCVLPGADRGRMAMEFFGGYILEFSLSMDNMFVFLAIFTSFSVPARLQRRALNYGVAGAAVLRLVFILAASELSRFGLVLYIFGGVLILSGAMVLFKGEKAKDYQNCRVLKVVNKALPFTGTLEQEKFFVRRNGRLCATLLFAVLLIIETSDIVFAIDSIPAIVSITKDRFIMYTSNIFAILGLRSLYFVIEKLSETFRYIKYGVGFILIFTGVKLAAAHFVDIPIPVSVGVIAGILLVSIMLSAFIGEKKVAE